MRHRWNEAKKIQEELLEKGLIDDYLKFNSYISRGYDAILKRTKRKRKSVTYNEYREKTNTYISDGEKLAILERVVRAQIQNFRKKIEKANK